jgi:hypothetical protein
MLVYAAGDSAAHESAAIPIAGAVAVANERTVKIRHAPRELPAANWAIYGGLGAVQVTGLVLAVVGALTSDTRLEPTKAPRSGVRAGFSGDRGDLQFTTTF